ncbi:MAG: hypothetical protein D6723_09470 [Acidobacteria bacterium]|nr:MAG: hypothetical protein D6723_09470 [Acidobacteriota bacterium]
MQGRERTEAFLSRVQIDADLSNMDTGLFILNPNNNAVNFTLALIDPMGNVIGAPILSTVPRGTFIEVESSLGVLFNVTGEGFVRVEAQSDSRPGTGERLILYGVYRGARFLSAVPAQF